MFSSEPVTLSPRSRNAAATDPIAVPQIPRKWKLRGASFTPILYAASAILATERKTEPLFFLKHFHRIPSFVGRLLFVFEGALQIHLGQKIVRIEFEET